MKLNNAISRVAHRGNSKLSWPRIIAIGKQILTRCKRIWTFEYSTNTKGCDSKKDASKICKLTNSLSSRMFLWNWWCRKPQAIRQLPLNKIRVAKIHWYRNFDGRYKYFCGCFHESFWNIQVGWNQHSWSQRWCGFQCKRQFRKNKHDAFIRIKIWHWVLHQYLDLKKGKVPTFFNNAQWLCTIIEWQFWRFMFNFQCGVSGQC